MKKPEARSASKHVVTATDLVLTGTITSRRDRIALLEYLPSGQVFSLRIGRSEIELVDGGGVSIDVLSILHDRVTLKLDSSVVLQLNAN